MATKRSTEELRRLWNEKVTKGIELTQDEKDSFVDAYWCGYLPYVQDYNLQQWVEDGCRSF